MRMLLTSVFKPFAVDDEFGSRAINPAELYHNQVTREQGPFSLRLFHRTWALMFLRENVSVPCTLLDFPTRARFVPVAGVSRGGPTDSRHGGASSRKARNGASLANGSVARITRG